jgi:phosphoglycolate phosphatase
MTNLRLLAALICITASVQAFVVNSVVSGPMWSSRLPMSESSSDHHHPTFVNVKAVIFDVDGTLADSWRLGYDATVVVLDNNNVPAINEEIYHECTRYATPERLARHAGYMPGDADFERVGKELGDEFDNLYVGLVTTKTAGFFDGISNLLQDIPQDVKLGALTNACVKYAEAVLEVNGATGSRFGSIRGADNVPTPKPSPDGLFVVCQDLGVDPKDCVYIGDSPSDIHAAKNAGMYAIAVTWGSHPEENLRKTPFDQICKTVDELKALLPIKATMV